eukprot:2664572-Pyramimonas_sp.AAC.1
MHQLTRDMLGLLAVGIIKSPVTPFTKNIRRSREVVYADDVVGTIAYEDVRVKLDGAQIIGEPEETEEALPTPQVPHANAAIAGPRHQLMPPHPNAHHVKPAGTCDELFKGAS